MRFLNQKLGKRVSRRLAILKSQLTDAQYGLTSRHPDLRTPKKGDSREQKLPRNKK